MASVGRRFQAGPCGKDMIPVASNGQIILNLPSNVNVLPLLSAQQQKKSQFPDQ